MYSSHTISSPVGKLQLVAGVDGLRAVLWEGEDGSRIKLGAWVEDVDHPVLREAEKQLNEYFVGARRVFDIPLDLAGTDLQKRVWMQLLQIPYGVTQTYSQLAAQIGAPAAVRAVGAANGRNPVSIIIPCHRLVGSNGSLTGFAGGLDNKKWLLELEAGRL